MFIHQGSGKLILKNLIQKAPELGFFKSLGRLEESSIRVCTFGATDSHAAERFTEAPFEETNGLDWKTSTRRGV